jgi:hypothetical protein
MDGPANRPRKSCCPVYTVLMEYFENSLKSLKTSLSRMADTLRSVSASARLSFAFWWHTESSLRRYSQYKAQAPHPLVAMEYLAIALLSALVVWALWSGFAAYLRNDWWRAIVNWVLGLAILWTSWRSLFPNASESDDA